MAVHSHGEREREQHMGRNSSCHREGFNKGAWTAAEDKALVDYIKIHGEGKWRNISEAAGLKRCGKSCRLRWLNYLRPDIKRGNITRDEEDLIIRLHKLLGNRWAMIAGRIPGRTDNEIKNYWNTVLSKRVEGRQSSDYHSKNEKKRNSSKQHCNCRNENDDHDQLNRDMTLAPASSAMVDAKEFLPDNNIAAESKPSGGSFITLASPKAENPSVPLQFDDEEFISFSETFASATFTKSVSYNFDICEVNYNGIRELGQPESSGRQEGMINSWNGSADGSIHQANNGSDPDFGFLADFLDLID